MAGDFMQIGVVTKNEIIKCVRGRKFLVSLAIVFLVFGLITLLQFIVDEWDSIDSMGKLADTYLSTLPIVITLVVALLSSVAIVSEFEERTALILFTRPIRRTTILIGKIFACTIIEALMILAYYLMVICVGFAKVDGFQMSEMMTSFVMSVLYAFAASGIAFIISAYFKKGSVCTIISILALIVIMPIISSIVGSDGGENWFMIDQAGNVIFQCIPGYVDLYNMFLDEFGQVVQSAVDILEGFTNPDVTAAASTLVEFMESPDFQLLDPKYQAAMMVLSGFLNQVPAADLPGMIMILKIMASSAIIAPMENPDVGRAALVLIGWGIAGYIIAWIKFIRREF